MVYNFDKINDVCLSSTFFFFTALHCISISSSTFFSSLHFLLLSCHVIIFSSLFSLSFYPNPSFFFFFISYLFIFLFLFLLFYFIFFFALIFFFFSFIIGKLIIFHSFSIWFQILLDALGASGPRGLGLSPNSPPVTSRPSAVSAVTFGAESYVTTSDSRGSSVMRESLSEKYRYVHTFLLISCFLIVISI